MPKSGRAATDARTPHKFDDLIQKVIESDTFRPAPVMRALLLYLWEHQGQSISEYAIATEALGRAPDFDPKTDSTVRVQVARLRTKLKEFYEAAGDSFPLRLTLPLGSHELHCVYQPPPQKADPSILETIPRRYLWIAGSIGLALLIVVTALSVQVHRLKAALPAAPTTLPRFWQSFLMPGKSTTIVVPSPIYFSWPAQKIVIRDLSTSDFVNWPGSPILKNLAEKWGPPEIAQTYVGAMEMGAGVKLLQYLEQGGQDVHLIESRRFPAESFAAQNTIFLGMPRTAGYLNKMLEKTNFYIARVEPDVIKSRNPQPGEPSEYDEVDYSADRRIAPAIVILLPARPEHTRMMLLLGRNLTSITSMLLTLEGLKALDEQWVKIGSPEAFEMVIQAEINRDTVLKVTPMASKAISSTFWK
ncbi:MAG TPA: helix-turn-helix domain-containing protein [Bryobacteraceae bacterium]|nr:helix-turn-helix domain-containing protein [Bryobacteraceae bacterium]